MVLWDAEVRSRRLKLCIPHEVHNTSESCGSLRAPLAGVVQYQVLPKEQPARIRLLWPTTLVRVVMECRDCPKLQGLDQNSHEPWSKLPTKGIL